jgi:hypothetical protein
MERWSCLRPHLGDISVPFWNLPCAQGLSAGSGQFRRLDVAYSNDAVVEPDILAARQYLGGHGQYSQEHQQPLRRARSPEPHPEGSSARRLTSCSAQLLITDAPPIGALCCA